MTEGGGNIELPQVCLPPLKNPSAHIQQPSPALPHLSPRVTKVPKIPIMLANNVNKPHAPTFRPPPCGISPRPTAIYRSPRVNINRKLACVQLAPIDSNMNPIIQSTDAQLQPNRFDEYPELPESEKICSDSAFMVNNKYYPGYEDMDNQSETYSDEGEVDGVREARGSRAERRGMRHDIGDYDIDEYEGEYSNV